MADFVKFSLDKLKLCYQTPIELAKELYNRLAIHDDFFTIKISRKTESTLFADVFLPPMPRNRKPVLFGSLKLDISTVTPSTEEIYCWFSIDNAFLYYSKHNYDIKQVLHRFEDLLSLSLNNISQFEVACDVGYNASNRIFAALRAGGAEPIILNKAIKDRHQEIDSITYELKGSLCEFTRMHIRIHSQDRKFQFYCYDKKQSIEPQNKQYILKHYKINPETLYRMECRVDTDHYRKLLKELKCSQNQFVDNYLFSDELLPFLWSTISKKFLRLRYNRKTILDPLQFTQNQSISSCISLDELLCDIHSSQLIESEGNVSAMGYTVASLPTSTESSDNNQTDFETDDLPHWSTQHIKPNPKFDMPQSTPTQAPESHFGKPNSTKSTKELRIEHFWQEYFRK